MFKTLKSGLAALTILTTGAGAAFAQPAGFATAIDPIADCSSGGFRKPSYCTVPVVNCITNPFGSSCATTLGTKAHTVAKVRYCRDQDVPSDEPAATTHPCHDTWGGANAANWAKQNPDAPDSPDTVSPRNQFLKGTADGLDAGDILITSNYYRGALYFDTSTFNGRALDGDATDGVAFFLSEPQPQHFYVGIFSGTDLGAPVMQRSGTASWVGQFQAINYTTNTDFVLEVTFGSDIEGKVGSIEAFVDRQSGSRYYGIANHFHLKGDFDDSGLITNGTVVLGNFTDDDRDDTTGTRIPGVLTGFIGQEGAVGAFYNNNGAYYAGGFIARPPTTEPKEGETYTETKFLNDTCAADPFHKYCFLEKGLQASKIVDCTVGNNVNTADCERAKVLHPCIKTPFDSNCTGAFGNSYDIVKANRAAFCFDNLEDPLCTTGIAKTGICTYAPFTSICFNKADAGYAGYKTERGNILASCRTNPDSPRCHAVTDRPNAITWEGSFARALSDVPAPPTDDTRRGGQFLKNLKDKSAGDIDRGDTVGDIVIDNYGYRSLNLNTATFNDEPLGGDAADGVAFFKGYVNGQSRLSSNYSYAGIFSGTDLGAPVTETSGTASWVGRFQALRIAINKDFVLEIDYARQSVDAFVQVSSSNRSHFYLEGNYDDKGVITGDFSYSYFDNNNRKTKSSTFYTGVITGLIGTEGAVGAFYSNSISRYNNYVGGFVARPPKEVEDDNEVAFLDDICTNNPFHSFCYLEVTKRDDRIKECIMGEKVNTEECKTAREYDPCITNPFYSKCPSVSPVNYTIARTNRLTFCNDDANKDNLLCTGQRQAELCTHDPFNSVCFNGDHYNRAREAACGTGGTFTDEQCAVAKTRVCSTNRDIFNPLCDDTDANKLTNRKTFCNDSAHATHADCTGLAIVGLCTYGDLFHKVCMDKEIYHGARVDFCGKQENDTDENCTDIKSQVTSLDWVNGFATKPTRVLVTTSNQFLQGTATGLDLGTLIDHKGYIPVVKSLNLKDATFDGRVLDEGVADGVAFSYGIYQGFKHYAGILSGTDLGAPLTQEYGKVYWNGRFQSVGQFADLDTDFTLEIDFAAQKITAFVHRQGNRYFHLKGGFNDDGVIIDGTVDYGRLTKHNIKTPIGNGYSGTLTGLIGEDGAVGAFYSRSYPGGGMAGGFVASPNVGKASYFHWLKSFGNTPPPAVPDTSLKTQFLQGTESGLDFGTVTKNSRGNAPDVITLDLADSRFRNRPLGGDDVDGVAFFQGRQGRTNYYYAGVLSGTNLGELRAETSGTAEWNGRFQALGAYVERDFQLKVDFDDTKVTAFVQEFEDSYYYLVGDFDARGVIRGTVELGSFSNTAQEGPVAIGDTDSGILRGLIGEDGAVGVFRSKENATQGYAGGFVAVSTDMSTVTYADWLKYNPLSREPSITPRRNQFLKTTQTGLNTGVTTRYLSDVVPFVTNLNLATATYNNVALGGNESDGVAFFEGYFEDNLNPNHYAGILSGTDLGAPVNQTTGTAKWPGRIQTTNMPAKDFTLEIDFRNREVEAFVQRYSSGSDHYHLQGNFDDNGVIRGTVDYGAFDPNKLESRLATTGNHYTGIMRGLIGQDGAVGVFISDSAYYLGYAGGFVACPLHADGRCQSATR